MSQKDFAHNLIKGRIAEVVFEQMLREAGEFTVLPFGYEYVVPEVMHMKKDSQSDKTLDILRTSPDFVVINQLKKKVYLIEVKYRKTRSQSELKKAAEKMLKSWDPSYLFIASPDGFFFDSAERIINENGNIDPLNHPHLSDSLQEKYLGLLNKFEEGL